MCLLVSVLRHLYLYTLNNQVLGDIMLLEIMLD